jgi:hypothetical protein
MMDLASRALFADDAELHRIMAPIQLAFVTTVALKEAVQAFADLERIGLEEALRSLVVKGLLVVQRGGKP